MDSAWFAMIGLAIGAISAYLIARHFLVGKSQAEFKRVEQIQAELRELNDKFLRVSEDRARFESQAQHAEGLQTKVDELTTELQTTAASLAATTASKERDEAAHQERIQQLEDHENRLKDVIETMASKTLETHTDRLTKAAQALLSHHKEVSEQELEKRRQAIENQVKPLSESLEKYKDEVQKMREAHAGRDAKTDEQLRNLHGLIEAQSKNATDLKSILRGPTTRGKIGEMFLERVLAAAGLEVGMHYDMQVTENTEQGRARPDCIVKLPGDRKLPIDAKTPLNAYEESLHLDDEAQRKAKLKDHARNLRQEIDRLAKRPYRELGFEAEHTVMYLPFEASLSAALQVDPEITSYGWDRNILLTTPTLLYALLKSVAMDWRQDSLRKHAEEISGLGKELVTRVRIVAEHMTKLGGGLKQAVGAYNDAVGSIDRNLLATSRKFQRLGIKADAATQAVVAVDARAREFRSPELMAPPSAAELAALGQEDNSIEALAEDALDEGASAGANESGLALAAVGPEIDADDGAADEPIVAGANEAETELPISTSQSELPWT